MLSPHMLGFPHEHVDVKHVQVSVKKSSQPVLIKWIYIVHQCFLDFNPALLNIYSIPLILSLLTLRLYI